MMNPIFQKLLNCWLNGALLLLATACSTITEELPPCTHQLAFRYDYNLKRVDAFPVEVKKIDVFVFDQHDRYVTTLSEERNTPFGNDFQFTLSLPKGKYHLIAWAGRYDRSYDYQRTLVPGLSTPDDLDVKVRRTAEGIQQTELDDLWHGDLQIQINDTAHEQFVMGLIKDTNRFRIVVQGTPTAQLHTKALQFTLTDTNGHLAGDNSLLPDDTLVYRPYFQQQVQLAHGGPIGEPYAAVAELNTARLLETQHPRLCIRQADGPKLIDINLIQYLLLTKMEGHHLSAQEYLDRQDEYALVFFLDKGPDGQLLLLQIQINDWIVRPQTGDF